MRRTFFQWMVGVALAAAALTPGLAVAQDYPTKAIRLVVPFAAGGDIDPIARLLGNHFHGAWGQPAIVDSRPGAGGTLGSDQVAKSAPDGYTLLMCSAGPITIAPSLHANLAYAPDKDFDPITLIGIAPLVMLANDTVPVRGYADFVALAKAKPATITFATAGVGSLAHLTTVSFAGDAGVKLVDVPYRGSGPAIQDLISGHVNMSFNPMPSALAALGSGKVRPLVVTSAKRTPLLPDVPTLSELGVAGFDVVSWYGICAPKGLSKETALKINQEANKATTVPAIQGQLRSLGIEARGSSIEEFGALIKADAARWARVIKQNNVQPQ
ncbi:MAG: tripartite tricarboxylate transporter substrate binding protein [Alphaproteobacteria bacterium]|nr:tripartite tricarboxylate transporter substrate binding protein [Alphaproteobacteria bacterium]